MNYNIVVGSKYIRIVCCGLFVRALPGFGFVDILQNHSQPGVTWFLSG